MGVASMTNDISEKEGLGLKLHRRGKVRDVYDLGRHLLLVATDRVSAFDHVLSPPIPGKGRILTEISTFWFHRTAGLVPNHLVSTDLDEIARLAPEAALDPALFSGRTTLARKARRIDVECVVRGYLAGSGWKDYQRSGTVCGHELTAGLELAARLPEPIFTPATKADTGHDENISRETLADIVGGELAKELESLSIRLYSEGAAYMETRGLLLADTKFEFGFIDDKLCVIDEMLTPDSSRFWDANTYRTGISPESFDKQFVRDHLEAVGWDKNPPVPKLPPEVVEGTTQRYREALTRLTR